MSCSDQVSGEGSGENRKRSNSSGSETHVFLKYEDGDLMAVLRERVHLEPGQEVHVLPRENQVHLFDSITKERLG